MGNIETFVRIPEICIPIDELKDVQPSDKHLEKLKKIPKLNPRANRKFIVPNIIENQIIGYNLHEWKDQTYLNAKYISVEDLDSNNY